MWVSSDKGIVLCIMFCSIFLLSSCKEQGSGSGNVRERMAKRSKQAGSSVKSHPFSVYDQIAQESENQGQEEEPHEAPYGMRVNVGRDGEGMKRNPRAEPSYMRNSRNDYHVQQYKNDGPSNGPWGDGRQLSSFSLGNLQGAGSSLAGDYAFGDGFGPEDNSVAAGGHGHQSHGHGHGHGWGWGQSSGGHGHGGGGQGKDCNSALGLLGVLGLASYLQSVLRQMTSTAAPTPGGRRRREVTEERSEDLIGQLVPLLLSMNQIRDGSAPVKCALQPYCQASKILTKRLGNMGPPVCMQMRNIMESSIENNPTLKQKWKRRNALRELRLAARAGEKGKKCMKLYDRCADLDLKRAWSTTFPLGNVVPFSSFFLNPFRL